jgi:stage V sporulation protein SpoVS
MHRPALAAVFKPKGNATAQPWATFAVAEAVKRLAAAVEALHESG